HASIVSDSYEVDRRIPRHPQAVALVERRIRLNAACPDTERRSPRLHLLDVYHPNLVTPESAQPQTPSAPPIGTAVVACLHGSDASDLKLERLRVLHRRDCQRYQIPPG